MAQVPFIDIARYARDAGFAGTPHAIIIALSVPESGRNSRAVNKQVYAEVPDSSWNAETRRIHRDPATGLYWVSGDPNGGSFGLLQTNGVHDALASGEHPHKKPTEAWIERMFDPAENLKAAYIIHKDQGFEAWGAYTKGLHGPSMDAAKAAMDGLRRLTAMEQLRAQAVAERDRLRRELEATKADLETAWSQVARVKEVVCP